MHTPEPWEVYEVNYHVSVTGNKGIERVAEYLSRYDASRIVACVNALAGVEDPRGFVERVSEENLLMRKFIENVAKGASEFNLGITEPRHGIAFIRKNASAILKELDDE